MKGIKVKAHKLGAGADALRQARLLIRLPESQKVLGGLVEIFEENNEFYFTSFASLAVRVELPPNKVRRIVRHLARRGLVEYQRGLFNQDGDLAGSGYGLSTLGRVVWNILNKEP